MRLLGGRFPTRTVVADWGFVRAGVDDAVDHGAVADRILIEQAERDADAVVAVARKEAAVFIVEAIEGKASDVPRPARAADTRRAARATGSADPARCPGAARVIATAYEPHHKAHHYENTHRTPTPRPILTHPGDGLYIPSNPIAQYGSPFAGSCYLSTPDRSKEVEVEVTSRLLLACIALMLGSVGCGDSSGGSGGAGGAGGMVGTGGTGGTGLSPGIIGFVRGEKGSDLTLRRPDSTEEDIGSDVLFGWINGQLLGGNYLKQLRIGSTLGTIELRMSFPGSAPPTGLIEGGHELRASRLLLEDSGDLDEVQVEMYFQSSDPPFDPLTNALGTVEIFLDVDNGISIYDIAGEMNLEIMGTDGTYQINGYFWAQEIDP